MSTSPEAKELLEKLLRCNIFVLDEFATSVLKSLPTLILKSVDKKGKIITNLQDDLEPCRRNSKKAVNIVHVFSGISSIHSSVSLKMLGKVVFQGCR